MKSARSICAVALALLAAILITTVSSAAPPPGIYDESVPQPARANSIAKLRLNNAYKIGLGGAVSRPGYVTKRFTACDLARTIRDWPYRPHLRASTVERSHDELNAGWVYVVRKSSDRNRVTFVTETHYGARWMLRVDRRAGYFLHRIPNPDSSRH